ncbi:MAG: 2-hydroxyhepta-2,4-diene-1,7-dioate isomerase [Blastocatellia bacterium]|nr:MAG: 2-hydroxyhepta-2,4-diene-1,7-dioate isomerase [Blastocatellia bacterium]
MKLASFAVGSRTSYGIVTDGGLIDAGARLPRLPDVISVLAADAFMDLRKLSGATADFRLDEVQLLRPIPRPGKIVCVGVNYAGRNAEYKDGSDQGKYPSLFLRVPESFAAHGEPLIRPPESEQLDYEGELALVIGRPGRRIQSREAMSHVAGYTVCNEGTVRDWCRHGKFNVTAGKNFARSGSLGPFFVTRDEVGDGPHRVTTRVNGEVRQDETTDRLIFSIPALIAYISIFSTLEPGDVIVTGTPPGAGARFDPPKYLKAGDEIEVEVPGVGKLVNTVVDELER